MAATARRFEWFTAILAVFAWVIYAVPLAGQSAVRVPETADALLEQMSVAAGIVFAGEVTAVRRSAGFAGSAQDAAEGVVEIELRVEQSLRGPAAGSIYTLREWAGLWAGQSARYRIGQRLLLFLYPPDAHGLSAPVHGAEGAIPLRGSGVAPGPDDATVAVAEWLVDLRWLQAQVLRRPAWIMMPVRGPAIPNPIRRSVPESGERSSTRGERGLVEPSWPEGQKSEQDSEPSLVRAVREPGQRPTPAPVEAQPLSQVLALCHEAITLDAMRRRDAGR